MIKVLDIINKSIMTNYTIASGKSYLHNEVSSVVILEYESIANRCAGFYPGQFVLASYFSANENNDVLNQTLSHLIKQKVSAIAVKLSINTSLPEHLLTLAEEYNVPIIYFYNTWIEDLLINIHNILSSETSVLYEENILRSIILSPNSQNTFVFDSLKQLWPALTLESHLLIAYISSSDKTFNALHYVETLSLILHPQSDSTAFHFFKLDNHIVLMYLTDSPSDIYSKNHFIMRLEQLLRNAKLTPSHFNIGIFDVDFPLAQLSLAIQKAREMNLVCQLNNTSPVLYSTENEYKYIFTLYNDSIHFQIAKERILTLQRFDECNHTTLLPTLIELVKNSGDYKKTADQLYSHTNTIRYRQKKAIEILNLNPSSGIIELDILIKMLRIYQITETQ